MQECLLQLLGVPGSTMLSEACRKVVLAFLSHGIDFRRVPLSKYQTFHDIATVGTTQARMKLSGLAAPGLDEWAHMNHWLMVSPSATSCI